MTPPRTSRREQHELFSGLGLAVELHPEGKGDFEAVVAELITWYCDPARAAEAQVFSLTFRQPPPRDTLAQWVGKSLPADAEGDALIGYAADSLLIAGNHGASTTAARTGAESAPQIRCEIRVRPPSSRSTWQ